MSTIDNPIVNDLPEIYFPDKNKNLIRVDRNLITNYFSWFSKFGNYSYCTYDILLYLCYNSQRDIFNYGHIDLNNFCKIMGYKKSNLCAILPPDEHKYLYSSLSLPRDKKFITYFEVSLYLLGSNNIPYSYSTFDPAQNKTTLTTVFIQILKEINIHITSRNKLIYSFKTSFEFDFNISRLFFWSDYTLFPELRKQKILSTYLFLKSIENYKHHIFVIKDFTMLCNIANVTLPDNINALDNKIKFHHSKSYLIRHRLKPCMKYIDFDFKFFNSSGKWDYSCELVFNANKPINNLNSENIKIANSISLNRALNSLILNRFLQYYRSIFLKKYERINKETFFAWLKDSNLNLSNKKDIFFNCIASAYNISFSIAQKDYINAFERFIVSFDISDF